MGEDSNSDDNEDEIAADEKDEYDTGEVEVSSERAHRPMRRSVTEMAVGSFYHFAILCFYIYVHVYDATLMKKCPQPEKFFTGSNAFGGRWKYLTYINLVGHGRTVV